ncbi:MAG TPA: hypothetical protein VJI13_02380 [Candidatus Norongarragalinales archaeon]|nr:hypothetical protein [Candidatus Norongarragalinales archaeon]
MRKRFAGRDLAIAAILLVIAIALIYFALPMQLGEGGKAGPSPTVAIAPIACLPDILPQYADSRLEEGEYSLGKNESFLAGIGKYGFPNSVFADLPGMPNDLELVRKDFKAGKVSLLTLRKEYWKQPEFYPNFEDAGVPLMRDYPIDSHAAFGYGTYPAEYVVKTLSGASFDVAFIARSDWGVINYQGIKLVPIYPTSISALKNTFTDGSTAVTQDLEYVKCNIKITSIDPGQMTLEPVYPAFSAGWAKRVKFNVLLSDGIKPGKYAIGLDVVPPDAAYSEAMTEGLLNRYVTGGGFGTGRPWVMLFIEVGEG